MRQTATTDSVEPSQRLAFWTDMVCDTYVQLDGDAAAGQATIEGDIQAASLSTLHLSQVTATPQTVRRTPAKIARDSEDYFLVSISAVCGQRGAGHLMIGMIQTLAAGISTLAPASAHPVAESVTQILIAGLSALPAASRQPVSQFAACHREQVKACARGCATRP
jgi:hypothetical protein